MFYNKEFGLSLVANGELFKALFFCQMKFHEGRNCVIFMFVIQAHGTAFGT